MPPAQSTTLSPGAFSPARVEVIAPVGVCPACLVLEDDPWAACPVCDGELVARVPRPAVPTWRPSAPPV